MAVPIIVYVLGALALWIIIVFNSLVRLRNAVKKSWAGIDVQLKRRSDLIPNLITAVQGYMKHEKTLLESITKERTALLAVMDLENPSSINKANQKLTGHMKQLFAVAENYPRLRASENFMQLQKELSNTEDEIAAARRIYNENVTYFNDSLQVFPRNLIAKLFGFKSKEVFATKQKDVVKVEL